MKRRILISASVLGLLVLPATSLGGSEGGEGIASERRALGRVVASDTARQHPETAVARAKLSSFGKVSWQVASRPKGLSVEHAFIVRCQKGFLFDYYPGPGDVKTTKKKTPFSGTYNIPLADPDMCDFQVAGQIPGESEKRGRVVVRIYDRG